MVKPEEATMVIDGYEYDVQAFSKRHPGGSVLRFYYGQDATDAFENFHRNLPKARKWLEKLPRKPVVKTQTVPASTGPIDVDAEFRAWQQSLVDRGFFKPSVPMLVTRLLQPFLLMALGCAAMHYVPGAAGIMLALPLIAMGNVKFGWIQHEGGHNSLTTNAKVDKIIQAIAIGLGLSTCGWQWNRMHNRHHATPQKINHDMDLDTLPLVGFFQGCLEKTRMSLGMPVSRMWLRMQAWTFIPVSCGAMLWVYWVYVLHLRAAIQHDWKSLVSMLASHVLKPGMFVVFGGVTWLQAYGLFFVMYWLTAMWLFGHFSLSHTFTPVVEADAHKSWARFAMEHTVDISPGNCWVDWAMGYLNYQVIHHMFPSMPQHRGAEVSKELQGLAKRWGVKYTIMSYGSAWYHMLANLDTVGRHYWEESVGPVQAAVSKVKLG